MIKAVIFDKDGTLLDFDAFWVNVSVKAISSVLAEFLAENVSVEEVLSAYGVNKGITDIDGVLCKGTYAQMGDILYDILSSRGYNFSRQEVTTAVISAYNENSGAGEIKPTCDDLFDTLSRLKELGVKLAVVTTDNLLITEKCLKSLGVYELFDKIYTDDGKTPVKPNPDAALEFCKEFNLDKENVVMVGDTMTDVKFARSAGIKVFGLYKTKENREKLLPYADKVIKSISELLSVVK